MASQIIIPDSYVAGGTGIILEQTVGNRDQIDTSLTEGADVLFFQQVRVAYTGTSSNRLTIANSQTQALVGGQDLSNQFEGNGSVTVAVGALSVTIETGTDLTEPYTLGRDAASDAFADAVSALVTQPTAADFTITLDDGAGVPPTTLLTLADWDDTGLDVDFAALIEVGSSGENLYNDSTRGGSDTPLEGELGLGSGETVISRLWWNGTTLRFNDNDNPVALNLGVYYGSGAGAGQTIYLVTGDADNHVELSFDVATYYPGAGLVGGGWVNWGAGTTPLPAEVIEQLDGLDLGDRFIIASAAAAGLPPLNAAGTLDGGLAGSLAGVASLLSPTPLDAAGTLNGGLAGSLSGVASLGSLNHLDAAGTLDGGLAGSLEGIASLGLVFPLDAAGTLVGGLAGSVSGAASLGLPPLLASGTLDGGLVGSIEADAELYTEPLPIGAVRQWLERLRLPWADLPERWALTKFQADLAQRLVNESSLALREWSPLTCRPQTLQTWGETLRRPQRDGETVLEYRVRLLTYRNELVGTSGWVRDEVQRVTGDDPPRVFEFPRDGLRLGYDRLGVGRLGGGPSPSLTIGVEPVNRAAVEAVLEPGVAPRVSINYFDPTVYDDI